MSFTGNCHCGAVAFTVDAELPQQVISCNCSHCRRKGFLLAFFPAALFSLQKGGDALQTYTFNTHRLAHKFCKNCGTGVFSEGKNPAGVDTTAINMRCVTEADLDTFEVHHYDGASL